MDIKELEKLTSLVENLVRQVPEEMKQRMARDVAHDFLEESVVKSVSNHIFIKHRLTDMFEMNDVEAEELIKEVTLNIQSRVLEGTDELVKRGFKL